MKYKPMDFEEFDRLFRYCPISGSIFNRIDRGTKAKAGAIATSKDNQGYLVVQFTRDGRRITYQAHRVAWLLYYGVDPSDLEIDHIDRQSKTNNKIENLRLVSHGDNTRNASKRIDNTSGITGVSWNKGVGKWQARISKDGKRLHLGYFEDKFEAICARKSAENRLGYHPNHGK